MFKENLPLPFRPHHIMCTLGFQGAGYSPPFIQNHQEIKDRLTQDPETMLVITSETDIICNPCPHNKGEGLCKKEELIQSLDHRHLKVLQLSYGQTLTWTEALRRVKDKMTVRTFHTTCKGCSWKDWGVCEEALENLLAS